MIRFSQFSLRRGAKVLLEGADALVNPGERVGLIGANGSGKSSLFSVLRGELHADKGDAEFPAHWRVAHVVQEIPALDRPALEYAIDGDRTLRILERKLSQAARENDGNRIGEMHAALGDAGAYTVRSRAEQLLIGLGFTNDELETPVLLFHGDHDRTVPVSISDHFARERRDIVTYVRVPGARHVGSWNVDPTRYDKALREFLAGAAAR